MPIYEYGPEGEAGCEYCLDGFEIMQRITADRLTQCPKCDAPIRRLLSATAFKMGRGNVLGKKNLEKHGFTKYQNTGKGFERTAGTQGPKTLNP